MVQREVTRRRYESPTRARQAGETRRRIVEAGARLFLRDGYAATSIAAIAQEAGVAPPTVYAVLRSKANILRAVVDLNVRGDDEDIPLVARAEFEAIDVEEDPRKRLEGFARLHRRICEREAAVFAQLEAAAGADQEATELLAEHDRRRYETQRSLARGLRRDKKLRRGLTERTATDAIWVIASERTYLALVRDREWRPADYERWVADQLVAALLP